MKNTTKLAVIVLLAWAWLPTSMTDILIVTPWLIEKVGLKNYLIISAILIIILYRTMEGRTLSEKLKSVFRELRNLLRKVIG